MSKLHGRGPAPVHQPTSGGGAESPFRRRVLQAAVGTLLSPSWRLWAAPAAAREARFVLVMLRGAYDALSALVPYAEPSYYEFRPNLAIPMPGEGEACIRLDDRWGMHPALASSLLPLWQRKELAFVPFSGLEFVSRSHFEAQDLVEFGLSGGQRLDTRSGFLNRLVVELGGSAQAVSFTAALPPSMRGNRPVANVPLRGNPPLATESDFEQLAQRMYGGHALEPILRDGLGLRRAAAALYRDEMQAASRGASPAAGFAAEAGRVGRLMRERPEYSVGFVEIGGWDTHAGQGGVNGALANQLQSLGQGLATLAQTLGSEWERTRVVVMSEFGRTFRENGSLGTDHGHGTTLCVLGGGGGGGRIVGTQPELDIDALHQGRDIPVANEYRSVLAGLFKALYGLPVPQLMRVFPGLSQRSGDEFSFI